MKKIIIKFWVNFSVFIGFLILTTPIWLTFIAPYLNKIFLEWIPLILVLLAGFTGFSMIYFIDKGYYKFIGFKNGI